VSSIGANDVAIKKRHAIAEAGSVSVASDAVPGSRYRIGFRGNGIKDY
jgi:hypothetical protein